MVPFAFNPLMDLDTTKPKLAASSGGTKSPSGGGDQKSANAQAFDPTANLGTTTTTTGPASFPASSKPTGKKHSAAQSFRGDIV